MLAYVKANNVQAAAVIGGGLLGLEAAKAVADMNVKSHIIEFAPILMCRQVSKMRLMFVGEEDDDEWNMATCTTTATTLY